MYRVDYSITFKNDSAHGREETIYSEKYFDDFVKALAFAHEVNGEVDIAEGVRDAV